MKISRKWIIGIVLFLILCAALYLYDIILGLPASYQEPQWNNLKTAELLLLTFLLSFFIIFIVILMIQGKKSRQDIELERDNLINILNCISLPVFITDSHKKIEYINEAALKLFHQQREELVGQPCSKCRTCICNTCDCAIDKMISTGINQSYMEMNNRNFLVSGAFLRSKKGTDNGFIEVIQDVSEIVETKKSLEEKTLELETISENLAGGILITSLRKGFPILRCNQGYCDLIGDSEENCIGKFALDQVALEDIEGTENAIYEQLQSNDIVYFEHKLMRKDGSKIWVSLYGKQTTLHNKAIGVWMLRDINDRKASEQELTVSEERYRIAVQNTEDIILDYNIKTNSIIHTLRACEIYGVPQTLENAPENLVVSGIVAEQSRAEFIELFSKIRKGEPKAACNLLSHAEDGRALWNRLTFTTIFDSDHVPCRAVGVLHDITEEMKVKRQYERELHYREIITQDAALYYEVNLTQDKFMTGHERIVANYMKKPINDFDSVTKLLLEHLVYEPDRELVGDYMNCSALIKAYQEQKKKVVFEYRRIVGKSEPSWVECCLYLFKDEEIGDIKLFCYIRDINDMKIRELALQQKAERDLLTGLYNKITAESRIKECLSSGKPEFASGAFLLIDLDNFKKINDTFGHAFGDAVLSEISKNLAALFREADIVGRMGGDEFVVYMPGLNSREQAAVKAENTCNMFHSSYMGAGNAYKISGSVGISFFPEQASSFQELYKKADIALYNCKSSGKDTFSIYEEDMPEIDSQPEIGRKEIDTNAGKAFTDNVIEYVVRILYEAAEPERVMNAVLELVSKHFDFSRSFLFEPSKEKGCWKITFEWCADGFVPQIKNYQSFSCPSLEEYFDMDERLFVLEKQDTRKELRGLLAPMEICSLSMFSLSEYGKIKGFIGFADCTKPSLPSEETISTLHMVCKLLGTFLTTSRLKQQISGEH